MAIMFPAADISQIGELYDWLSQYVRLRHAIRFGQGLPAMHKILQPPEAVRRQYAERSAQQYTEDFALAAAKLPSSPRVLDAGCGFGGTIFRWHELAGGDYDGLTLSRVQWKVARREGRRRGLLGHCHFHLKSYDDPLPSAYDAVVAIEALIHSPSLPWTIGNLARALKPGGRLVLVEDMASPALDPQLDADARMLRTCWRLAGLPSTRAYRALLMENGLRIIQEQDHSEHVVTQSPAQLNRSSALFSAIRAALPLPGPRFVADALLGGLALERLYRRRLVSYQLLVGRKAGT
jgi:cyclopropane fatty-acyl-phospholipid synthase-like methyltransferase